MNKKQIKLMIGFLLITVLFISGCKSSTGGFQLGSIFKGKQSEQITTFDPRVGTQALQMAFIQNMPPDVIYMCDNFNFGLNIKNTGATDINAKNSIFLVASNNEFKFVEGNEKDLFLRGKSAFLREGDQTDLFFPVQSKMFRSFLIQKAKNYTTQVKAVACMPYSTEASADICINPDIYGKGTTGCVPQPVTLSGGQGAPVAVTKIIPQMVPFQNRVQAKMQVYFKNMDSTGRVYALEAAESQCQDSSQLNKAAVTVSLGGTVMDCQPSDLVKLYSNKESAVTCTLPLVGARGAYTTPVTVKIDYTYYQSIGKQFKITLPPGIENAEDVPCNTISTGTAAVNCAVVPDGTNYGDNQVCMSGFPVSKCAAEGKGRVCQDISLRCPELDSACLTQNGCSTGMCPGPNNIVCCP